MSDTRRTSILDAATRVFLRYGFKKTSMDDVARAADLSRQALYSYFESKELLFKEAVLRLIASTRAASKAALSVEGRSVEERILGGLACAHGNGIEDGLNENGDELIAAAEGIIGPMVSEVDAALVADIARVLKSSGVAGQWKSAGLSAKELAETLLATSYGMKHRVANIAEYTTKMRVAVQIVCSRKP